MSCDLPSAVEKIYGIKYGDPSSPERLKAVANLISSLILFALPALCLAEERHLTP
jgi:hypothetical protein